MGLHTRSVNFEIKTSRLFINLASASEGLMWTDYANKSFLVSSSNTSTILHVYFPSAQDEVNLNHAQILSQTVTTSHR